MPDMPVGAGLRPQAARAVDDRRVGEPDHLAALGALGPDARLDREDLAALAPLDLGWRAGRSARGRCEPAGATIGQRDAAAAGGRTTRLGRERRDEARVRAAAVAGRGQLEIPAAAGGAAAGVEARRVDRHAAGEQYRALRAGVDPVDLRGEPLRRLHGQRLLGDGGHGEQREGHDEGGEEAPEHGRGTLLSEGARADLSPLRVEAAGTKPKLIDEYVGSRQHSARTRVSVAHMRSPGGWVEPGQRPDFDEYTRRARRHAARRARGRRARRERRPGACSRAAASGSATRRPATTAPSTSPSACPRSPRTRSTATTTEDRAPRASSALRASLRERLEA